MTQHGPDQPNPAGGGGLPNDLSQGWLPEDKRQTPTSPLPAPKFWGFQSLLPYKAVNGLRHPGELPWLIAAYSFTLISYIGLIVFIIESFLLVIDSRDSLGDFGDYPRTGSAEYYMQEYLQQFVVLLVLGPLLIYIARAILYAQQRVRGIRMSPTQFPEGYQMVVEAARAAGLRRVPDAYVISGNGTLNAFAAGHGFRRYICVYSDMFEVGGKTRDPEALRYVIGHEVGHIAAGHVSYFRLLFTNSFMRLPVVGQALSRAQEYTADNFGYRLSPDGARGGMKVLAGGKYLNKQVNFDEFADRAVTDGGLAVWFVNLISSHPVLTWRAHAIRNRQEPGRLFWRPTYNPPSVPALIPSSEPVPLWPDPLQADAFMQEQKPAWENYSLDTVQLHTPPNPEGAPKFEGTLYTGWQDAAARAAYASRWEQYAASGGQQPMWQPPGYSPAPQPGQPQPYQPNQAQPQPQQYPQPHQPAQPGPQQGTYGYYVQPGQQPGGAQLGTAQPGAQPGGAGQMQQPYGYDPGSQGAPSRPGQPQQPQPGRGYGYYVPTGQDSSTAPQHDGESTEQQAHVPYGIDPQAGSGPAEPETPTEQTPAEPDATCSDTDASADTGDSAGDSCAGSAADYDSGSSSDVSTDSGSDSGTDFGFSTDFDGPSTD